ncbi:response regulator [Fictibacillus sp. WQ 8-8]|uniref:response regulator transcription factor n=1 Tax=Fictibacillus sp. WQ 8-8 TaxID=2938788 RepID=UPI00210DA310|nr:response regulator [Fictibacillus sp. WQ 8-8]MCQ6268828.1 response regulator [Fictibacillus sp. WQ 8-8]
MIVDDEPLEREVLTMMIKRVNLGISQLFEATNGVDALELAKQNRMDVVLMDIKMPIMDGLEAAKMIQKDVPDCRIIFLTAYDERDFAHKTMKSGTHDYLLKPAHPSEIRQALVKYIPVVKRSVSASLEAACDHDDILTVMEYIENNLHLELNLDTLSSLVHLCGQYLSRLFKQETGCTITQYITVCRLEKAKKCFIYSSENVMEISEKCGFSDPNYFRVFKKYEGVTPTQYQQQSLIGRKKRINSFNNFVM